MLSVLETRNGKKFPVAQFFAYRLKKAPSGYDAIPILAISKLFFNAPTSKSARSEINSPT